MRARSIIVVVAGLLLPAGLACTGGDDDDASGRASSSGDADQTASAAGSDDGGGGVGGASPVAPAEVDGEPLQTGRSIIATAEVSVEVDDVAAASRRARDIALASGGFVAAQDADLGVRQTDITIRVPAAQFDEALDALGELGTPTAERIDTDDVTDQIVDLESRIASGRASVARLRDLLGRSGDVAQLASVESELARREADLESLIGQQRVLQDRVDLSSITTRLTEVGGADADDDDELPGFVAGLRTGWDAFITGGTVALATVGFVLPFLPALAAVVAVALWRRRSAAQLGEVDHAGAGT